MQPSAGAGLRGWSRAITCGALLATCLVFGGRLSLGAYLDHPLHAAGRGLSGAGSQASQAPEPLVGGYLVRQTRTAKAGLIEASATPPRVVIFGGSRAMRIDPTYLERRLGLSGLNLAVTAARGTDTWALLNLLHARFPTARFRFIWVVHVDQFDARGVDPAIMLNPSLARFFASSLVQSQVPRALHLVEQRQAARAIDLHRRPQIVYGQDGYAVRGFFSGGTAPRDRRIRGVAANIRTELQMYTRSPAALDPRSVTWFERSLKLMNVLAVTPPVIVAAPIDHRISTATLDHGWRARHHLLLGLLARLRRTQSFGFLDLSNATSFGITAQDFYDGIHLTPKGGQKLMDLVVGCFWQTGAGLWATSPSSAPGRRAPRPRRPQPPRRPPG